MRLLVLCCAAAAALVLSGSGAARVDARTSASLRLVSLEPVAVRGAGFAAREPVRIVLSGPASRVRRTVASRAGSFAVRFDGVVATRCDVVRVVAVGGRGSRAGLKFLPAPACMPD